MFVSDRLIEWRESSVSVISPSWLWQIKGSLLARSLAKDMAYLVSLSHGLSPHPSDCPSYASFTPARHVQVNLNLDENQLHKTVADFFIVLNQKSTNISLSNFYEEHNSFFKLNRVVAFEWLRWAWTLSLSGAKWHKFDTRTLSRPFDTSLKILQCRFLILTLESCVKILSDI